MHPGRAGDRCGFLRDARRVGLLSRRPPGAIGLAALEAMACEVPVVSTNVGGLPELIRHEETGLLLNELSPQAIADGIRRLAADKDLAGRLVEKAGQLAHRFDGEAQVRRITEIYVELSGR